MSAHAEVDMHCVNAAAAQSNYVFVLRVKIKECHN